MAGEGTAAAPARGGQLEDERAAECACRSKGGRGCLIIRTLPLTDDVLICPPATLVLVMAEVLKSTPVAVGAQDCHTAVSGAHTGDVSAEILADAGATAIIVGHSERRADHGETDAVGARQTAGRSSVRYAQHCASVKRLASAAPGRPLMWW